MKYLFIDIECANNYDNEGKVCEFGYVVSDENFNIVSKEYFLINPDCTYDWYVVKKLLAFKKEDYNSSHKYPYYYPAIKTLLEDGNTIVFGHTIATDIKYLNDESRRYNLPFVSCRFYDVGYIYNTFTGNDSHNQYGVSRICKELNIEENFREHKSDDDAYAVLLILKKLCSLKKCNPSNLIAGYPLCSGETKGGEIARSSGKKNGTIE